MLIKAILLAGILFVIYTMFFKKKPSNKSYKSTKDNAIKSDVMLECTKCETFVSEDEAIVKDGKFYCSKKCASMK